MNQTLTSHAAQRIRQRGFRESDVQVIFENGTPSDDGILLSRRDVDERIAEHRAQIAQLERLQGAAVFVAEGQVVSLYRPSHRKARRMLRDRRSRAIR